MKRISEHILFFREFLRSFHTTGAILPSGRFLARALTRFVAEQIDQPRTILEAGPGTGAVTQQIIARMGRADTLDMVELNEAFVCQLNQRFQSEASFRAVADRARVLHCSVEELPIDRQYDLIVSGLPLNNFTAAQVDHILKTFDALLAPGGTLSFFEYIAVRKFRAVFSNHAERRRLDGIGRTIHSVLDGREVRRDAVLLNIPPAWVHHLRKPI